MINSAPLAELANDLRLGRTTPRDYIDKTRDRYDSIEPDVLAFVDEPDRWGRINSTLETLPGESLAPSSRPPLYGVPVGVKDIFHVEGLPTRAGSDLPPAAVTGPEAESVRRLREAGAIVLGKTVTTEFAYFEPGPTRNPHNPNHTPGGSSSGSAAAVAAGLCPVALGSQTVGSVNRPASFCGVVGLKPSYGRISLAGVIPFAESVDHVGFFTQDVAGARIAASVLYDDWQTIPVPRERPTLGIPEGPYLEQASPQGRAGFREQVDRLETDGYEVRRVQLFDDIDEINDRHYDLIAAEFSLVHNDWFSEYGDRYSVTSADLVKEGYDLSMKRLAQTRASRRYTRTTVQDTMTDHGIDAWITPAAPGPAPESLESTDDPAMNLPWTHTGLPSITVPGGFADNGLPLGLQCAGSLNSDETLLAWAGPIAEIVRSDN